MITELTMPSLSPTMEEGTLVAWHAQVGDKIAPGSVIAEVQTDKAVVEWESLDEGYLAAIVIEAGTLAKVNAVAGLLTSKEGEDLGDAVAKAEEANAALAGGEDAAAPAAETPPLPAPAPAPAAPAKPKVGALPKGKRVSPVAVRLATKNQIDLNLVDGTGPDGRIVKADVIAVIEAGTARIGAAAAAGPKPKPKLKLARPDAQTEEVGLSQMRQVIGKRLLQSKTTIPHFYVTEKINAGPMVDLRAQLTAFQGVKLTFNDLVLKACALALRQHPTVNSTFHGDRIIKHDSADISVAVAIPDGLITPIVFNAHALSVAEISKAVKTLAGKAKEGTLQPQEFEGGSFTISNLGMFGIEEFNAIVNPPQAAIIAVGGIKEEAVIENGAVVPGKTLRVTLSCDHRVVDGADAAGFLKDLRELLERPAALLL